MTLDMHPMALSFGMALAGLVVTLTYRYSSAYWNAGSDKGPRWMRPGLAALSSEKTSTRLLLSGYLLLLGSMAFGAAAVQAPLVPR